VVAPSRIAVDARQHREPRRADEQACAEEQPGVEERPGVEEKPAFLDRAEVRDVLAWMRLLVDPHDAAAVVRALARPPIELRQVHLALVIQLARRRKVDLVEGLATAIESPQVPPEARERIQRFIDLHERVVADLDELAPELFLTSMIEALHAPGRALLAPEDAAERQAGLEGLQDMGLRLARGRPGWSSRELLAHLASAVSTGGRTRDRGASSATPDDEPAAAEPLSADEELGKCLSAMRAELLESVWRIGGRLGELRLDTDLDIAHGVVRYLEMLKVAALLQRGGGESTAEGLADINARLLAASTPLQREILQTSTLDDSLLSGEPGHAGRQREERSLGPFLPRKGVGLALSASDIETYRSCPLRYKFSRVLRIPSEQTLGQRFGITVHQVLERFHAEGGQTLMQMLELLDAAWRRAGLGYEGDERVLHGKAQLALTRYQARLAEEQAEPVWFERSFAFRIGPHHLRGRVDRVDRLPAGAEQYELIDYKTSRPKSAAELREDVQLSLYALAAREAWELPSSRQSYYYVLDDRKVPVPRDGNDATAVEDIVLEVGEGILAEAFEPTPSPAACALCDYRIVCPASEA
jgi:RecB family exonuclease